MIPITIKFRGLFFTMRRCGHSPKERNTAKNSNDCNEHEWVQGEFHTDV